MSDRYFLHGTGRNQATRSLRARQFPRETTPRVGPFVIRPGRSFGPLTAEQLAGYEQAVLTKLGAGTIQVLRDNKIMSTGDVKALFASVRGEPNVVNYEGMDLAALHSFTRDHQQDDQAWYWLVLRLVEAREIQSAVSAMDYMARIGVELDEERAGQLHEAIDEAQKAFEAENAQPPSDPEPPVSGPEDAADEPAAEETEEVAVPEQPVEEPPQVVETTTEEPTFVEEPQEPVAEEAAAEEVVEEPAPKRALEAGWRELSNKKLAALITEVGAEMPAKTDKSSLIGALDAWLKG